MSIFEAETIAALTAAGFTCREWRGQRLYLKHGTRDAGYLVEGDDGSTGTCSNVTVRAGSVAQVLRALR